MAPDLGLCDVRSMRSHGQDVHSLVVQSGRESNAKPSGRFCAECHGRKTRTWSAILNTALSSW